MDIAPLPPIMIPNTSVKGIQLASKHKIQVTRDIIQLEDDSVVDLDDGPMAKHASQGYVTSTSKISSSIQMCNGTDGESFVIDRNPLELCSNLSKTNISGKKGEVFKLIG
jgi:hypothetical protein